MYGGTRFGTGLHKCSVPLNPRDVFDLLTVTHNTRWTLSFFPVLFYFDLTLYNLILNYFIPISYTLIFF